MHAAAAWASGQRGGPDAQAQAANAAAARPAPRGTRQADEGDGARARQAGGPAGPAPPGRDGDDGGAGDGAQAAASSRNASPSRASLSRFPGSSLSGGSGGGYAGGAGARGWRSAAAPGGPRRPGLLHFKDAALEAEFAESYNRSPFVLSAERGFDLAHLSVAVVAFAAQRLGAAGLGDYGSSRAAALFTLAHVFLTLATISARAMTAEHFRRGRKRGAPAAAAATQAARLLYARSVEEMAMAESSTKAGAATSIRRTITPEK